MGSSGSVTMSSSNSSVSEIKEENEPDRKSNFKEIAESVAKNRQTGGGGSSGRKNGRDSVKYDHHQDDKTYESCAANVRIQERIRKQRIEFSNDLRDVITCMPSALDALKFEVLVGSKIDPFTESTASMLQTANGMMDKKQQERVETLMEDDSDLYITRKFYYPTPSREGIPTNSN